MSHVVSSLFVFEESFHRFEVLVSVFEHVIRGRTFSKRGDEGSTWCGGSGQNGVGMGAVFNSCWRRASLDKDNIAY